MLRNINASASVDVDSVATAVATALAIPSTADIAAAVAAPSAATIAAAVAAVTVPNLTHVEKYVTGPPSEDPLVIPGIAGKTIKVYVFWFGGAGIASSSGSSLLTDLNGQAAVGGPAPLYTTAVGAEFRVESLEGSFNASVWFTQN